MYIIIAVFFLLTFFCVDWLTKYIRYLSMFFLFSHSSFTLMKDPFFLIIIPFDYVKEGSSLRSYHIIRFHKWLHLFIEQHVCVSVLIGQLLSPRYECFLFCQCNPLCSLLWSSSSENAFIFLSYGNRYQNQKNKLFLLAFWWSKFDQVTYDVYYLNWKQQQSDLIW